MKKLLHPDLLFASLLVAGVIFLLSFLPDVSRQFNILGQALADIDLTDIVYSKLELTHSSDTNIVIINEGNAGRKLIGSHLKKIADKKPKAIGVDFYFPNEKPAEDSLLNLVLKENSNIVLGSFFINKDMESPSLVNFDTLIRSAPKLSTKNDLHGFMNLMSDKSFKTIRTFQPFVSYKDSVYSSFAVGAVRLYDSLSINKLRQRNKKEEIIAFKGSIRKFQVIDREELENDSNAIDNIKGKLVLYGFLGANIFDSMNCEDKFFTPMNESYVGRTLPDMYGIVIHANIAAMILEGEYIESVPDYLFWIFLFWVIYLNIAFFEFIKVKLPKLYGGELKIFVFVEVAILLYFIVWLFENYAIKINGAALVVALLVAPDVSEIYFSSVKNYILLLYKKVRK